MGLVQFCGRSFGLGTWSNVAEHMPVYYVFGGVAANFLRSKDDTSAFAGLRLWNLEAVRLTDRDATFSARGVIFALPVTSFT